jgi:hypothetical protein
MLKRIETAEQDGHFAAVRRLASARPTRVTRRRTEPGSLRA